LVTISHGHGHLNDCYTTTDYTKTDDGNTSTFTIDNNDYFKLNVTVSGGNEETKVVNDNNIGISTTLYPTIRWRYKTSDSNIKAKIIVEFNDASTQEVVSDASSTTFTVGTTTLTTGKTLDHIRLYADHATGTVYYDYCLVYVGDFTFPTGQPETMNFTPKPRFVYLGIPGKVTDNTQNLGCESAIVDMTCNLDIGTFKRSTDTINGEVFLDISHNSNTEPWQWLDTELEQFKVSLENLNFNRDTPVHMLPLRWREFSLGDKSEETYAERFGIGL
jgi:hypothetical protein